MSIPTQYQGLWKGKVYDSLRKRPYIGEISLSGEGGNTIYWMSHGPTTGKLTAPREMDGRLVLNERLIKGATSWDEGTLSLKLDGEGHLECSWRGIKGDSEATMIHVPSTAPSSD